MQKLPIASSSSFETSILAVDDEPAVAESLSYVLEAVHRRFATACDGEDALAKIAQQRFDLIITDHRMPRLGGLELVRRLRQQAFAGKIVVLSAHLSPENVKAYQDLAVDRILAKPFDASNLRKVIGEIERGEPRARPG